MSLSDLSIKNPVFAVMVSAAMIVFGWLGYRDMGVSQFPEIDFPVISVVILREGAAPHVMDGDVTEVVEDAVAGVEGVNYIMSQSLEGMSIVTIFFRLNRSIDVAMQDVDNAVKARRRYLPIDIDPPVILKVNPNNLPVMWLTLSGNQSLQKISDFAEKQFKPQLTSIPEVGGVQFSGLLSRNIRIWLDHDQLSGYNLDAPMVREAIQRQHAEMPAGYIQGRRSEANLRVMGEAYSLDELNRLLIAERNGQRIFLGDVSTIEDGFEDRRSLARYNRMPAVAVGIRKAIGGNLVACCENVKKDLPRLKKLLPPGVEIDIPVDYSLFVRENVDELRLTLFLGIVLTAGVCFLFLGSLGTTINICLSIPTSLVGTFFVINYGMKLFGQEPFTINLMTLLALSLSVGVVVDDAILVLENIYRHREQGMNRREAALRGAREISFAAVAATFSIMAIFLPVAFMTGTIGKFFFQFGVTVGVAVLLSLLCALTLTPMLCAFFLDLHEKVRPKPRPFRVSFALVIGGLAVLIGTLARLAGLLVPVVAEWAFPFARLMGFKPGPLSWMVEAVAEFCLAFALVRFGGRAYWYLDRFVLGPVLLWPTEWVLERLTAGYARLLRWSLRHWGVVLSIGAALILLAVGMIGFDVLGQELVPSEDQSRFVVHVVCPVGSSIDQVDELLAECERSLVTREDVAGILSTVGTEQGQLMNEADLFVHLVPQHQRRLKQQVIMRQVRANLEKIKDIKVVVRDQSTEGFTAQRGDPVDFALLGNWDRLPAVAGNILATMRQSGKFQDLDSNYRPGMPELQITPDRDRMGLKNITTSRLAENMSLLAGGPRVAKFTDQGRRYDVRLRLRLQQRTSPDDLAFLTQRTGPGFLVPLADIAEVKTVSTLPVINRYNHQRTIEIIASPAAGVSQGEAIEQARQIAESLLPDDRFTIVELGNAQAMQQTMRSLVFALVLGIVIAYMILGVQFNSFVHPFTVLLAMPFAATGALVTLWLTGGTLNMMSMIGLILLMGLVKKNSIILVDYTNQLRDSGLSVQDAVLQACPVRLRPILMTSVATVAGAVPAAFGLGPGAETRAPMARGIIGGIILSTLVTLVLVPVFYVIVERLRAASSKLVVSAEEEKPDLNPAGQQAGKPA